MRLVLLISFTMVAFASNSLLTRMAIGPGLIDPYSFALIRVLSGAAFLCAIVLRQRRKLTWASPTRLVGAASLTVYMIGFSAAYVSLDAGLGALLLFGVVQVSMFAFGAVVGTRPGLRQIVGAVIAFAGLSMALWPGGAQNVDVFGAFCMIAAGLGWAAYTLSGKSARDPLAETAANFVMCFPALLILTAAFVSQVTLPGILLAILCGAVTSGLGYALWYHVLPNLERATAAVVQLSVPVIAILAGSVLLSEPLTLSVAIAAALVVLGIGMAVTKRSAPADHTR